MRRLAAVLVLCAVAGAVAYGQGRGDSQRGSTVPERSRIYNIEELTWPQIDAFNRERTLFILPAGILEEHGPHLPVGADTLAVTNTGRIGSDRVGSGRIGSGRIGSDRVGSGRIGSASRHRSCGTARVYESKSRPPGSPSM
jgi:hypothetical protein